MLGQGDQFVPYEEALRIVGRYLDEEDAREVWISEEEGGFAARYRSAQRGPDPYTTSFTWPYLRERVIRYAGGRVYTPAPPRPPFPVGHRQDFLRSLGFALDRDRASGITLEDVPDGVAVSYDRKRLTQTYGTERISRVITHREIDKIVRAARSRRDGS